jgi:PhnB protein
MKQLNAYLNFNGQCHAAMTFYKECLGGELYLQTIGESPMASQMPNAMKDHILHSTLTNGEMTIMSSDMIGNELKQGTSVFLMLNCSSSEEIKTIFAKLSAGGKVRDPLAEMHWGATYGSFIDKFGMNWMLNFDRNQPQ